MPAHITVLFPFVPVSQLSHEVDGLHSLFAVVTPFDFALTSVGRFERTAYLEPDGPERFTAITEMVANRWPAFPPYGRAFSKLVPHLTVADQVDDAIVDLVTRTLTPRLPIVCRAVEAWVLTSDANGHWSRAHVLPFAS